MSMVPRRRRRMVMPAAVAAILIISIPFFFQSSDGTAPELTPEIMADLLKAHSPIFRFDSDESLFPTGVDSYIVSSRLMKVNGPSPVLIKENVSAADLLLWRGPDFFLDEKTDAYWDDSNAFTKGAEGSDLTVYGRAWEVEDAVALQYWAFYAFNRGPLNSHEGDWELVQIMLDRTTLEPRALMLSQHRSGERVGWDEVRSQGGHSIILVARGSHANYLLPEQAAERGDRADGSGPALGPDGYALVALSGTDDTPWLNFEGRWGDWGDTWGDILGTRGPQGPMFREGGSMWSGLDWTAS